MRKAAFAIVIAFVLGTATACPSNPPKQPPPTIIIHKVEGTS